MPGQAILTLALLPATIGTQDTIQFVQLEPNRMVADCADAGTGTGVCRVRRQRTARELESRLESGEAMWREGNELSFVWQGPADAVELTGGIQVPMSRLSGSDMWTVTVRVARPDEAVVAYAFLPTGAGATPPRRLSFEVWRGASAMPAPDSARTLSGRLMEDTISSRHLSAPRAVTVYAPPSPQGAPPEAVIYVGDGQVVRGLAPILDTMITSGRAPRVLLVGMHSADDRGTGPGEDGRTLEYLSGIDDSTRFLSHERFLLDEVMPWARTRFGAPSAPDKVGVLGFSNSAAFALDMGIRHPELVGRVLAFSPAGRQARLDRAPAEPLPRFYLLGGLYEHHLLAKARAWGEVFERLSIPHQVVEVAAGHDPAQWDTSFPDAVLWAFGAPDR